MKHRLRTLVIGVLLAGLAMSMAPTQAESGAASAFQFAESKKWNEALAHARSGDPALQSVIMWRYALEQDSGASFDEITTFIRKHPGWPRQERLRLRAEQSLRTSDASAEELEAWFAANPPVSGIGKIKLAEIMIRNGESIGSEKVSFLIRDAWRNGDFEDDEEERIRTVYRSSLREQDHASRADRLLWEEKIKPVKRMLSLLPKAQANVARARMALLENAKDATFHLGQVSNANRKDPGLIYSRMLWRDRKKDAEGVKEMLLAAPTPVPYPEKWWKIREQQIRRAIDRREYKLARKLLANHGQTEGFGFADATWLSGWLSLEFLNDPQDAYLAFYKMFDAVKYPVSKARAAYWAGRAATKAGDDEASRGWYKTAAGWPTTFYGQLAHTKIHGEGALRIPRDPSVSGAEQAAFADNEMVQAIKLAASAEADDVATELLNHLIDTASDNSQAAMAAELGTEIHSTLLGVRGAKRAMQRGIVLLETGYPRMKLRDIAVEEALALAVTRQESEFDANAKSRAGAIGMMQLLPRTAKETARKAGMSFSESKLYEPSTNIRIGSVYLNRLVNAYDGSLIMALAAYNAGPGNVREWIGDFGSAEGDLEDVLNWIEMIPFAETRNYVQRVIENLQVYRHILNGGEGVRLALASDLTNR